MNDYQAKFEEERADIKKQLTQIQDEIQTTKYLNLSPERLDHLQASLSGLISRCSELDKLIQIENTTGSNQEGKPASGGAGKSDDIDFLVSECKHYMIHLNKLKDGNQ